MDQRGREGQHEEHSIIHYLSRVTGHRRNMTADFVSDDSQSLNLANLICFRSWYCYSARNPSSIISNTVNFLLNARVEQHSNSGLVNYVIKTMVAAEKKL